MGDIPRPNQASRQSAVMGDVYMAKLAEQAERYEEMVEYMKKVATSTSGDADLTLEVRPRQAGLRRRHRRARHARRGELQGFHPHHAVAARQPPSGRRRTTSEACGDP